jgi:hypothetical protein
MRLAINDQHARHTAPPQLDRGGAAGGAGADDQDVNKVRLRRWRRHLTPSS